jgi:hypothetical protein
MNKILENEEVQRQLLKLGRRDLSPEERKQAQARGVHYDPLRAQLAYNPNVTVFAASRPLDNRTYTYLKKSGMLYRFHILQREIGDAEAREFFVRNYKPDTELYDQLLELNTKLLTIAVKDVKLPSQEVMNDIFLCLDEVVQEETHGRNVRLAEVIDIRVKGDILRELAAAATLRIVAENGFNDIDHLKYDSKDVDFIKSDIGHFVEARLYPLFAEEWSQPAPLRQTPRQKVEDKILDYLADGRERGRGAIVDHILPMGIAKEGTIDNALRDLVESGSIVSTRHGFYKIADGGKKR